MLKGKKIVMEFETYEKEATQNTLVSAETKPKKKFKFGFLGNNIMHARTSMYT